MNTTSFNSHASVEPINAALIAVSRGLTATADSRYTTQKTLMDLEDPTTPAAFHSSTASRRLIDVGQTHRQLIEFVYNQWFNELCGQTPREEAILLAGAPGSNKSTLARQLALDLVTQGYRALIILTEESAERAKAGFLKMASDWPPSKVQEVLGRIHVETGIRDVESLGSSAHPWPIWHNGGNKEIPYGPG